MLIVFEGPNGSGKTTLLKNVSEQLKKGGEQILSIKFPSTLDIGLLCRKYATTDNVPYALACLIAADFYSVLAEEIEPQLTRGNCVLCDRYTLSSYVYQVMHGVPQGFMERILVNVRVPDLVFFLQVSPRTLKERRTASEDSFDSHENITAELALYDEMIARPPEQVGIIHVLDGENDTPDLAALVVAKMQQFKDIRRSSTATKPSSCSTPGGHK